jgi:hypothetical protein
MAKRNVRVLVCLVLGALLAGCGGSTHASTAQAPTARYVAEGNAICAKQLARLSRLPRPTTPEQTIAYLPTALTAMHAEVSALRTLDPPGAGHTELAAALADTNQLAAMLGKLLDELQHSTVEFTRLGSVEHRSTTMRAGLDARFRQLGLTSCAE